MRGEQSYLLSSYQRVPEILPVRPSVDHNLSTASADGGVLIELLKEKFR
jgi:hypothetical protein